MISLAVVSLDILEMHPLAPLRYPVDRSPVKNGIMVTFPLDKDDELDGTQQRLSYILVTSFIHASKDSVDCKLKRDLAHSMTLPPSVSAPPTRIVDLFTL